MKKQIQRYKWGREQVSVAIRMLLAIRDRKIQPKSRGEREWIGSRKWGSKRWAGFMPNLIFCFLKRLLPLPQLDGVHWQSEAHVYITLWPPESPVQSSEWNWLAQTALTWVMCTCLSQSLKPGRWRVLTGLVGVSCPSLSKSFTKVSGLTEVKCELYPVKPEVDVGR